MKGWSLENLKSLAAEFSDGDWIESKDQSDSGIRLIQTGNVGVGEYKDKEGQARYISTDTFRRLNCNEIYAGDILISRLPDPPGRACIIPPNVNRMITAVDCAVVRFPSQKLISKFFNYFAQSTSYLNAVDSLCTGATRKRISRASLGSIQIPVPPLDEQKRIVAILDEAFEGIAKATVIADKNLANARDLFDSRLATLIYRTTEVTPQRYLMDVCLDFGRGKSKHRPRNDPRLYGGPYPFIQTGDLSGSHHSISSYHQTYSEFGLAQSKIWPKGTVCVAIVGATIGESGILDFDGCFPDSVIGMVADPSKASPEYLQYLLESHKMLIKSKGVGSARHNINLGTFEQQSFPFPPIERQIQIVSELSEAAVSTEKLIDLQRRKLLMLDELKQSLLDRAFTGQLTSADNIAA